MAPILPPQINHSLPPHSPPKRTRDQQVVHPPHRHVNRHRRYRHTRDCVQAPPAPTPTPPSSKVRPAERRELPVLGASVSSTAGRV